jgi:hypothetical protein
MVMQTLINRVIIISIAILVWTGQGLACFQSNPAVRLRTRTLSGIITSNGNPIGGSLLRLYKSSARSRVLVGNMDISAKQQTRLGEMTANKQGRFSFGEVPAGKYVLVTSGGSTDLELTAPGNGEGDIVAINAYGMGCQGASVIPFEP